MAKTNITQYSATPSSNTDINSINIDENCPASGLNNAIRELMAHLKNVDTGSQALTALSVAGSVTATTSLKTPLIEFTDGDNALTIADGGNVTANADLTVTGDIGVGDDVNLTSDSSKITFGADSEIEIEHAHNEGLKVQGSGTNTQLSLLSFHATDGTIPDLRLGKSGSDTIGTFTTTADGESIGQIRFTGVDTGNSVRSAGQITVIQDGDATSNSVPAHMRFSTGGGERARFNDNGYIEFRGASQVRVNLGNAGTAGTNNSNWIRGSGNQIDLNTNGGGYGFEVSGNTQLLIATNGAVTSQAGTYGSISDENLKENIADANSQWDDIKALRIRNYSMISDSLDTADKIGVIAQELESAGMNGLVEETNWRNQTVKSVKQSILYMKAVKALQEAMTRIETLETENTTQATQIADLISRVTALENA